MKRQLLDKVSTRLGSSFFEKDSVALSRGLLGKVMARKLANGDVIRGTIVETEAYPGASEAADLKAHAFITKKTEKNAGIFMEPGTTWVYMTYGVFNMMNISARGEGSASLIRAVEPKENYDSMQQFRIQRKKKKIIEDEPKLKPTTTTRGRRRGAARASKHVQEPEQVDEADDEQTLKSVKPKKPFRLHELCNGPGKLCKSFDIQKDTCDQVDLSTSDELWLEENDDPNYQDGNFTIAETTRIGIDSAPESSRKDLFRFYIFENFSVSSMKPGEIRKKIKESESAAAATEEVEEEANTNKKDLK